MASYTRANPRRSPIEFYIGAIDELGAVGNGLHSALRGAKRALADGLAARGTEAVAADALRRRWDVVAPVIEDEAEEEGSKGGEERG